MSTRMVIDRGELAALVAALWSRGYEVIGPTARDGAIVHDLVRALSDLPIGKRAVQSAGAYAVEERDDNSIFGFTNGPTPWRRHLHPPRERLVSMSNEGVFEAPPHDQTRRAFFGMRSCDIAALGIYDQVMLDGAHTNERYAARREGLFIVAVQCAEAAETCFCASMNTGPRAGSGFDLALTEFVDRDVFMVEIGSEAGAELLGELNSREATSSEWQDALQLSQTVAESMSRTMRSDARQVLRDEVESTHWEDVAARCLSCGNCTNVCPTCFCTSTEDLVSLDGSTTERWERWDSCFSLEYSHLAGGGSVRNSIASRYRNWLTHKLSTWHDQFGSSGCVGCGRCVSWCPAGIDLTHEVARLAAHAGLSEG